MEQPGNQQVTEHEHRVQRGMLPSNSPRFTTTHWSVVRDAGDSASPQAGSALETLCQTYWYPLYAYVRRRGYDANAAKDLTQEFFAQLLVKGLLAGVDPAKGRFRSWLLGVMNHFLAHEWAKAKAQKRGGDRPVLSLDDADAEDRYRLESLEDGTPERLFDRRWALAVLEQAAAQLRAEYEVAGKKVFYLGVKQFVSGDGADSSYAETARGLGLSVSAVKSAIHRLRQRYQALIRAEIARTVARASEVDDEIRHLLAVLRG